MRALRIHRHGLPVFDADAPDPVSGPGQGIVELAYAGINPVDVFIMQGTVAAEAPLPRVLGIDGAGYLDGRRVMVHGAGVGVVRDGTLADLVAAPEVAIVPIPQEVSFEAATGCGNAGATAVRLFMLADPQPGDRALVLAASGSVGAAVCSLVSTAGITVLGQVRRGSAVDIVRGAGAKPILVPTPADLAVAVGGERPTILFDPLGGAWTAAAIELLPVDARHIVYGTITGQTIEFDLRRFYRRSGTMCSYRGILEPPERLREAVALALTFLAEGRLWMPLGVRIPLSSAAQAYDLIGTSHTGRIVIEIGR
jgi:NADPH2:quinone reductase